MAAGNKTDNQEIGTAIWLVIIRDNNKKSLWQYDAKELEKTIIAKPGAVKNALEFLKEEESKKGKNWSQSCKTQAEGIIKLLKQKGKSLSDYGNVHQDGDFFNKIRKKGKDFIKNAKGLKTPDKWNPSDIYLTKNGFQSILNVKTLAELNSKLAEFDSVIGVSLKGMDALHGASSLSSTFAYMGLKEPKVEKWATKKDAPLSDNHKNKLKTLLKEVKAASTGAAITPKLFFGKSNRKLKDSKDANYLVNQIVTTSDNWGQSVPPTLQYLKEIPSKLWFEFAFWGYCVATSRVSESASHFKVDGAGHTEIIETADIKLFKCNTCRIEMSGQTGVIFDANYGGENIKLQIRSKGSLPQMMVIKTSENADIFADLKELRF